MAPPLKESWLERRLREVVEESDFMNLEGAGKPIPDIDQPYDGDWWLKKMMRRERLSVVPPAVETRHLVDRALDEAWRSNSEVEVRRKLDELNAEVARRNATNVTGPATTAAGVDVEAFLVRWRAREP